MPTTVKHCFKGVSLIIELDNKYKYYKIQNYINCSYLVIYLGNIGIHYSF